MQLEMKLDIARMSQQLESALKVWQPEPEPAAPNLETPDKQAKTRPRSPPLHTSPGQDKDWMSATSLYYQGHHWSRSEKSEPIVLKACALEEPMTPGQLFLPQPQPQPQLHRQHQQSQTSSSTVAAPATRRSSMPQRKQLNPVRRHTAGGQRVVAM